MGPNSQRFALPENVGRCCWQVTVRNYFTKFRKKLDLFCQKSCARARTNAMKINLVSNNYRALTSFLTALLLVPACALFAQGTPPLARPGNYTGRSITGELVRNPRVNIGHLASGPTGQISSGGAEIQRNREDALHPPVRESGAV